MRKEEWEDMAGIPISEKALATLLAEGLIRAVAGNDYEPAYHLEGDTVPHLFHVPPPEDDDTTELEPLDGESNGG